MAAAENNHSTHSPTVRKLAQTQGKQGIITDLAKNCGGDQREVSLLKTICKRPTRIRHRN